MIDHLTAAILAAARLDDATAVAHFAEHLGAAGYGIARTLRYAPRSARAELGRYTARRVRRATRGRLTRRVRCGIVVSRRTET